MPPRCHAQSPRCAQSAESRNRTHNALPESNRLARHSLSACPSTSCRSPHYLASRASAPEHRPPSIAPRASPPSIAARGTATALARAGFMPTFGGVGITAAVRFRDVSIASRASPSQHRLPSIFPPASLPNIASRASLPEHRLPSITPRASPPEHRPSSITSRASPPEHRPPEHHPPEHHLPSIALYPFHQHQPCADSLPPWEPTRDVTTVGGPRRPQADAWAPPRPQRAARGRGPSAPFSRVGSPNLKRARGAGGVCRIGARGAPGCSAVGQRMERRRRGGRREPTPRIRCRCRFGARSRLCCSACGSGTGCQRTEQGWRRDPGENDRETIDLRWGVDQPNVERDDAIGRKVSVRRQHL